MVLVLSELTSTANLVLPTVESIFVCQRNWDEEQSTFIDTCSN